MDSSSSANIWGLFSMDSKIQSLEVNGVTIYKSTAILKPTLPRINSKLFSDEDSTKFLYALGLSLKDEGETLHFVHVSCYDAVKSDYKSLCCFEFDTYKQFHYIFKKFVPSKDSLYRFNFYHAQCADHIAILIYKPPGSTDVTGDLVPDGIEPKVIDKNENNLFIDKVHASNIHVYVPNSEGFWTRHITPMHLSTSKRLGPKLEFAGKVDNRKAKSRYFGKSKKPLITPEVPQE